MNTSERTSAADNALRLARLDRYNILDTPAEQGFDDIVLLATQLCNTPVALVSLVADDRQWFKAKIGFDPCQTPLSQSVCVLALQRPGLLIIPDLSQDPRTRDNTLVTGPPHIRFYAGARLETPEGDAIGMLCVIDTQPRPEGLTLAQESSLEALARQVMGQMELRRLMVSRDAAVLASEARQRIVFGLTRQLFGILNLDGVLLEANPAALDAIDGNSDDALGRPFWETPWFTQTPGMEETIRRAVEAARSGQSVRTEMSLIMPDGGTRIYDFSMHPVRGADGSIIEIMPEASDITALRTAEESLRQAQKMEAVGQLTGGLAHDFNNLLTGITGSLELINHRIAQGRTEELGRYIAAAQDAARRAAALTHRLLAFSRRQTLKLKVTDVNRLVVGMEELIRRTIGSRIRFEVITSERLWPTLIDAGQLENALLNLCINARDAMPEGGTITVETSNRTFDARSARKRDLQPGCYLSLCVSDTGTGMTPEVIAKAFDPFFTTKPIGAGTGLGLSMIYGFARQSGGASCIFSELGNGTSVCLYLPRHVGEVPSAEPPPLAVDDDDDPARQRRILVVEDEATVRLLVSEVVTDAGYLAVGAANGTAGLAALHTDEPVDLLITDVRLPDMNGQDVARAARKLRPGLTVLFITGYAENLVHGHFILDPGMHVMTKPFTLEALANRIKDLIDAQKA